MELAHPANNGLFGLLVEGDLEGGVLLAEALQGLREGGREGGRREGGREGVRGGWQG
jgi:hypothetical protein